MKESKALRDSLSPAPGQVKLYSFTLIERLVITAQHCRHFIFNACTVLSQNTPLFLKEKGSARGKENFFSREKKLSFPLASSPFTLIELLVVIAIIAILAAMLMPALQKARAKSITSDCQSREKQLGTVFTNYADDYGDWLPGSMRSLEYNGDTPADDGVSWQNMLSTAGYLKYQGMNKEHGGIKRTNILACPGAKNATAGTNFGINVGLIIQAKSSTAQKKGVWNYSGAFIKRSSVRRSSSVAQLGDANETTYQIKPNQAADTYYPAGANFTRHQGINMLFIDGHVELMQKENVLYWSSGPIRYSKPWF